MRKERRPNPLIIDSTAKVYSSVPLDLAEQRFLPNGTFYSIRTLNNETNSKNPRKAYEVYISIPDKKTGKAKTAKEIFDSEKEARDFISIFSGYKDSYNLNSPKTYKSAPRTYKDHGKQIKKASHNKKRRKSVKGKIAAIAIAVTAGALTLNGIVISPVRTTHIQEQTIEQNNPSRTLGNDDEDFYNNYLNTEELDERTQNLLDELEENYHKLQDAKASNLSNKDYEKLVDKYNDTVHTMLADKFTVPYNTSAIERNQDKYGAVLDDDLVSTQRQLYFLTSNVGGEPVDSIGIADFDENNTAVITNKDKMMKNTDKIHDGGLIKNLRKNTIDEMQKYSKDLKSGELSDNQKKEKLSKILSNGLNLLYQINDREYNIDGHSYEKEDLYNTDKNQTITELNQTGVELGKKANKGLKKYIDEHDSDSLNKNEIYEANKDKVQDDEEER